MPHLYLPGQLVRFDTKEVAANLARKGWTILPEQPDPTASWDGTQWVTPPPAPPQPDFTGFIKGFYQSEAFQGLIAQRDADPSGTIDQRLLALKLEMAAAQSGAPNAALIQDAISRLVASIKISPERGQEIAILMAKHNLAGLFELAPAADPIDAQWVQFGAALAANEPVNALVAVAAKNAPVLHLMLGVGLGQAAKGDPKTFLAAWATAKAAGLVSAELADSMKTLATSYKLPAEFVEALGA